jgi:hypothetical protein
MKAYDEVAGENLIEHYSDMLPITVPVTKVSSEALAVNAIKDILLYLYKQYDYDYEKVYDIFLTAWSRFTGERNKE